MIVVHPHRPGLDTACDGHGVLLVFRPHGAAEAVDGIVGNAHRLVLIAIADHRYHRAEDLLLGDAHLVIDFVEDRRRVVIALRHVAGPFAAGHTLGTLLIAE